MTDPAQHGWRRRLTAWVGLRLRPGPKDPTGKRLRPAQLRRYGDYTALQFARGQTQSRMRTAEPDHLLIDYTRSMLGCLLWRPQPACIGMVGLGGGSQVKFCHRHLPAARIEVAENHPGVIALRRAFGIPDDDARLQVVLDDGARFLQARPGRYDLLLVDGYDETGIPEALATQAFYDDCRAALAPGGVMACNLYCDNAGRHVARLRKSFGGRVLLVEEAKMSNRVAFAWIGTRPPSRPQDVERALGALSAPARAQLAPVLERMRSALRSATA
ncbi:MAG: fused MFS/spermidine synthase [Pseudomonadota bacterium]|nr:fused MFS/spermidine synthase [Pseudomonadota bacterium]